MDAKSIQILELPKILERVSKFASFSAGASLALSLTPSTDFDEVRRRQQETSEARRLLAVKTDVSLGGARDVRAAAQLAARAGVLDAPTLLDIKSTLIAARTLRRLLSKLADQFPRLAFIAEGLTEIPGLVEAISNTLDERGEVLDSASPKLAEIRRDLKAVHGRLLQKLERLVTDPRNAAYLQEAIVTQRDGRYVIPLKADFKGRIRGVVHDQSASGATLFVEPLVTVELNNELRELQLAEQSEIRRILTELSAFIGEQAEPIVFTVDALAALDLAFAKAKYAEAIRASEPVVRDEADNPQSLISKPRLIRLLAARHPLLNPETVVPIDVELGGEGGARALVITGPNTGGKTVTLKTVGLLALMAQCGLHLPAQSGSELSLFRNVFADIGDEQSIEQSLSTFSAHFTNIVRILEQVDERCLVILDELGAGTDPAEGSALARAVLSYLLDKGATVLVATHYPELKVYAQTRPDVKNASMEFDPETLLPTFHLTIGLPGRSNAFAIAARLGLNPTIIADARKMVTETTLEAERLLDEIYRQREIVRAERERAEAARAKAEEAERLLTRRLEAIEAERRKIIEDARQQTAREAEALREELARLKARLARATDRVTAAEPLAEIESELKKIEEKVAVPTAPLTQTQPPAQKRAIRLGDTVKLKTLNSIGVVTALTATEAEVKVGRLRVRAKLDEVELRGTASEEEGSRKQETASPAPISNLKSPAASPGLELDIRGKTVDEALPELERYLDQAYLAELPWVRIIHGKGTGKLRQAVREYLRNHPQVKSATPGAEAEGGEGVTVVRLAVGG
ncbi:MAG: endonuclease MutS2 [Anaerolineales bacterium]|nr:endonuclease MutS2 [Anaerolineales bacterium]